MENTNYSYIKKESVISSLRKMQRFEKDLDSLFSNYNLSLRENTGRRNILVSQAQEVFFARELSNSGLDVTCSGKTGEPDITIHSLEKELECKLTSSKKRSWPLQCDYTTLKRKGATDFLYVLSDGGFENFAVLFFDSLTVEDFHPPAPGSRQKSRMKKSRAMEKCVVLHGSVSNKSARHIQKYVSQLESEISRNSNRVRDLNSRLSLSKTATKKKSVSRMISNEASRHQSKKAGLLKKIQYWNTSTPQYEIKLECVEG